MRKKQFLGHDAFEDAKAILGAYLCEGTAPPIGVLLGLVPCTDPLPTVIFEVMADFMFPADDYGRPATWGEAARLLIEHPDSPSGIAR